MERFKKSWTVLWGDLALLASLYIAHFIVWRAVRAERKQRGAPLKKLTVIEGEGA